MHQRLPDPARLWLNAGDLSRRYPEDAFPGHAAWLDWPWKLHRIETEQEGVVFEFYNLGSDPAEANNRVAHQPARVESMAVELSSWQRSVVRSLNGADYS